MFTTDYLSPQPDDDRLFLAWIAQLLDALDDPGLALLVVVRIRNWFDQKWLRFSGKGRIPFDGVFLSHPGVALASFSQDELTFPPFTPRRIVDESHFTREPAASTRRIHRRQRSHSAENLHRRVRDHSKSLSVVYLSTGSDVTGRGSVMVYTSKDETLGAWYASFQRTGPEWQLGRVKGIDREQVLAWLQEPPAPDSGTSSRG